MIIMPLYPEPRDLTGTCFGVEPGRPSGPPARPGKWECTPEPVKDRALGGPHFVLEAE